MAFIDEILQTPSYGWMDASGVFLKPTTNQLFREAFSRINIFKTRKNWITLISWFMAACMFPLFVIFLIYFLTWKTAIVLVVYAMVIMSTHGRNETQGSVTRAIRLEGGEVTHDSGPNGDPSGVLALSAVRETAEGDAR